MQQTIALAQSSPLFEGIDPGKMDVMLNCIGYHVKRYEKGESLALEEADIQQVGILLSGSVDMVKEDIWGNKTLLLRVGPGELFGESFACAVDSMSTVSFVAAEDCEALFLPFRRMMHTCSHTCEFHHRLIENMVTQLAEKNQSLMQKVEVISKKTLREKILAYLMLQVQKQGSKYIELPLSRVELADYLCADRSALTRELSKMREDGLIDYDRNTFRVL